MSVSFPTVNGKAFSFASVTLRANGIPFRAVKGVDYSSALERQKLYGTDRQAFGRTGGQYKGEASLEIWREQYGDFIESLGDGFMEVEFDVEVQFQEDGQDMQEAFLPSVCIAKGSTSMTNSADGLSVKIELDVLLPIIENGLSPIATAPLFSITV